MSTHAYDTAGILAKRRLLPPVVLVVEQDQSLRETISSALREEGCVVLAIADEALACDLARDNHLALILLDSHSFQTNGCGIYHQLRICTTGKQVPLLLLINQDSEMARFESNGLRVDDYIRKPLRREELSACVQALLRKRGRAGHHPSMSIRRTKDEEGRENECILVAGDLRINVAQRIVLRGTDALDLESPILFDLLVYLVRHRGVALTREQLYSHVWGYDCRAGCVCDTRTVVVHMHWLRDVLGDDAREPRLIQTVRSIGYRFVDEARSLIKEREQTDSYES